MAMTRQLWTLNGLATELGKDRRTLGRLLRHVPADGTARGGYKGWFMETVLRALSDDSASASGKHTTTPIGFEIIDRVNNPVGKASLAGTASSLHGRHGGRSHEGCLCNAQFHDCGLGPAFHGEVPRAAPRPVYTLPLATGGRGRRAVGNRGAGAGGTGNVAGTVMLQFGWQLGGNSGFVAIRRESN
jgi:hypothetical protein